MGTAATEFAVTLPLVLLLALACADFGRISHYYEVVCNAARTGAESGATHKFTAYTQSDWQNDIHDAVLAEMQNIPDFKSGDLAYNLSITTDIDNLATINVSVTYPFRTVVAWPGLPSQVMLHKTIQFRQFR